MKIGQSKGISSAIPDDSTIELQVNNLTIVIYIQNTFNEILSIGYLVMAEDGKNIEILSTKGQ